MKKTSIIRKIETIFRVLCDIQPETRTDAIHLYAQTSDNEGSVLEFVKKILDASLARRVILVNTDRNSGYSGFSDWKQELVALGISEKRIVGAPLETNEHNTLTEAQAVIGYAKHEQYRSIIVSAPPFHQVRAFMTSVGVALVKLPQLKIYSIPGRSLPWNQEVIHSQGSLSAGRIKLIESELSRIDKYYLKGDLISYDEVINYLDRRDEIVTNNKTHETH